ncbi:MAG: biotin/lipoyl-binding protein [Pseudomonadales bacterium]|nr:biotin/lipoyl-binding protein [Pseudomonadales bacterium]
MARHQVESEVAGSVWKVEVAAGDAVAAGDVLMILESMKMEIPVESPVDGVVEALLVAPEDQVAEEQVLAVVVSG